VKGLFFCLKQGGVIINVTSVAARMPDAGNSLYNASKSAAAMLTQSAAGETGKHGIRIIEVAPGPIDTPMLTGYLPRETAKGSAVTEKTWKPRPCFAASAARRSWQTRSCSFVPHPHPM
jgi:NAD(P)-dependent dehydrogenase (short-subunit alcohol dehydrogenase family)